MTYSEWHKQQMPAAYDIVGYLLTIQQARGTRDFKSVLVHTFRPDIVKLLSQNQFCRESRANLQSNTAFICITREWDALVASASSSSDKSVVYTSFGPYRFAVQSVVAEYRQFRHTAMRMLDTAILLALTMPVDYHGRVQSLYRYRHPDVAVQTDSYILLQCNPMKPIDVLTTDLLIYYEWVERVKHRASEKRPTVHTVESKSFDLVIHGNTRACVYGFVASPGAPHVFYVRALQHTIYTFHAHVESAVHMAVAIAPNRWSAALTAVLAVVALHLDLPSILDVHPDARLPELADVAMCNRILRAIAREFGSHDAPFGAIDMALHQIATHMGSRYSHLGESLVAHWRFLFELDASYGLADLDFLVEIFQSKCDTLRSVGRDGAPMPEPLACMILFLLEREVYDLSCVVPAHKDR